MCCTCTMNLLITYFLLFGTDALIKGRGWVCKIVQCYAIGPNIWHKGCFKCQVCNMTLNMKNYKGYNKLPYCNAHYPTTKPTQVADTPENRRIADNTKIQSNVQYHSDFEKAKGSYTQVSDRLDLKQHQLNTENISMIAYHKDFEEGKGRYIQIEDPVEMRQHLKNQENISLIKYHEEFERSKGAIMQVPDTVEMQRHKKNVENFSLIKYHEDFERQKGKKMTVVDDPETQRVRQNTQNFSQVAYSGHRDQLRDMEYKRPAEQVNVRRSSHPSSPPQSPGFQNEVKQRMSATSPPRSPGYRDQQEVRRTSATSPPQSPGYNRDYQEDVRVRPNPGSIHNYDPVRDQQQNQGTPYSSRNSGAVVYDSNTGRVENPSSQRRVGSISDYDPINDRWGSVTGQFSAGTQQPRQPPPPQQFAQPPAPQEADRFSGKGMVCRAAYDYVAADDDEVSFNEGDHIIFCQPIDAGWMEGTVEATGRRGMLPSNYVETVKK
ncbi:LIM zinc-binding domain-containing Nebulette,LIM and SH3 domain protein F42H10.3,LIM and SH3 domain protein Lasp [Mytilus coruscus]|uniref:LIM zinc-binding domain-containing Nebulette,LIM and SH3 domain protein F42H10.3,LIM and SH3 domain protein Lasp n=1 Tax=Mytilus coruscus TaxID=42192 RepID=A0A6J8EHM5_MYTCO|nr:LIM zinc-binding domain-containing Nebulette,LIM and SH3 domain protein F42H10.3,LIM and SH3 domain protein Lasp [Mytilus coruscus]